MKPDKRKTINIITTNFDQLFINISIFYKKKILRKKFNFIKLYVIAVDGEKEHVHLVAIFTVLVIRK